MWLIYHLTIYNLQFIFQFNYLAIYQAMSILSSNEIVN